MNLFLVAEVSPHTSDNTVNTIKWLRHNAQILPDRHVVKMILESAQIVMTALHIKAVDQYHPGAADDLSFMTKYFNMPMPLTNGHRKHPVIKWAADKRDTNMTHIAFVLLNAVKLCDEYHARYGRHHTYHETLLSLLNLPAVTQQSRKLPEYLPLCANSAWDTKVLKNYIATTTVGIEFIVALQRHNFIRNKPWIATNYRRAAFVPQWVDCCFGDDSVARCLALDAIIATVRTHRYQIAFVPVAE